MSVEDSRSNEPDLKGIINSLSSEIDDMFAMRDAIFIEQQKLNVMDRVLGEHKISRM